MKKLAVVVLGLVALANGYAQPKKVLADKIVAIVGDKVILRSDVENAVEDASRRGVELPPNARCIVLSMAMQTKALVLQAERDSLPVSDDEVEAELEQRIRYFVQQYGGTEAFEEIAGRTVYQVKEDFRQSIREGRLEGAMRDKIVSSVKITPTEVRDFYNRIPKDSLLYYETELEMGQIVIFPKASRDLEKYAQDELMEYRRQIESGQATFENLARLYTDDPGSKETGGRYEVNRNSKELDATWLNAAFSLKEGQVSRVIKSRFGYHILQMVSRNGDDAVVRHILKIPKVMQPEIDDARRKLDSIRAQLITGSITFGEAVNKYSDDENSKFTAGFIAGRNGETVLTIESLDRSLIPLLDKLRPGEYSEPMEFQDPQSGKKGVRIVYLQRITEPHRENLTDDYSKIAQRALAEKKANALEDWFRENMSKYYVMVDQEYAMCEDAMKLANATSKK